MSPTRDVFAIVGLPPEILAVAMAKYSRSTAPIKETIDELTEEKSADFHEKWVLGYGDASVADMAVVAIAVEGVSTLATKVLQDNRLAAFQEKSSRYVAFDPSLIVIPPNVESSIHGPRFRVALQRMMEAYDETTAAMVDYYRRTLPAPPDMKPGMVARKIKARSLDVSRYLQPLALQTNFGMIMSARSLRHAISKMLGSPYAEVRAIGEDVRRAAIEPAYNPTAKRLEPILEHIAATIDDPEVVEAIRQAGRVQVKGAPTLIKHTEPKPYLTAYSRYANELARDLLAASGPPDHMPGVALHEPESMEDDLIATTVYGQSHHSYAQIMSVVRQLSAERKTDILTTLIELRGEHDWPRREYEVGQQLVFDTLMIWGAFYDLQRHRICTQINQLPTLLHGYEEPRDLRNAGVAGLFHARMQENEAMYREMERTFPFEAQYLLTKGHYKRTLFKMNLRELFHVVELRTKPGGHFAYRDIAYQMYERFRDQHPDLAVGMRAVKMDYFNEFFQR